ncbi:MAG TPA: methyltransferase domain-containing protein [Bacteroidales bacterium]|nr:methyltransferase domain-containing protein [Bacteroidales bacterium]
MKKNDWNPAQYLKFDKERLQPSIDLVARIDYIDPAKIIDIGCGPGNSTQVLLNRWPGSKIVGADNSQAMIKRAKEDYPEQKWILFDAGIDLIDDKFDIVFSNATIQWIPDHGSLIQRFSEMLIDNGVLAVQLPLFFEMPLGRSISVISKNGKWSAATNDVDNLFTINDQSFYYDNLARYFRKIDIWTTDYYHVMDSQSSILAMIRSTGLKPYLERISDDNDKKSFEDHVMNGIKNDYPLQANGKVLFPFKRLFFIAKK